MDPQNILNSKGFIIEMIKTGTNANFLLKNTLKTDAVFTIYMAAETEFLYIESEKHIITSFLKSLFFWFKLKSKK